VFNLNYDFFFSCLAWEQSLDLSLFCLFFHQPEQLPEIGGFFICSIKIEASLIRYPMSFTT
jgi:hypothetical protein